MSSKHCETVKEEYDKCFNMWLTAFLKDPSAAQSSDTTTQKTESGIEEHFTPCKELFDAYQACLEDVLKDQGLTRDDLHLNDDKDGRNQ
ncbi:hypothetical protein PTSG_11189 [Salpingoeca rosetta]|uniref:TP53 regulated inhibitor of apoptosis 1 n=1 Tax=Salpingoeca rosetta (strain ATCC 50818 / BSB-021) TaxID=946362 RepID=F2USP1_SALR5|nr:uncharacterized protein PTSG_11189 [Salpingoeca rosetta]EGD81150.1 hypothetical protein PTSG_11189 [Salpingoeca rosetta]|eukprot:XP_004987835.1 hypothetical protein PTSG_11189 [Salpingoeca rosetta]